MQGTRIIYRFIPDDAITPSVRIFFCFQTSDNNNNGKSVRIFILLPGPAHTNTQSLSGVIDVALSAASGHTASIIAHLALVHNSGPRAGKWYATQLMSW